MLYHIYYINQFYEKNKDTNIHIVFYFYRLEEILVIVGVPVCPAGWLFLYGTDRDIGRRGIRTRDLRLGIGISESVENVLRRGLGLGFGRNLGLLIGNKARPVRLLQDTPLNTNTLIVEMAALHSTLMTHDVGAADLTLGVADVMRSTKLHRLSCILADLAKRGILGLLLVDTTGHSAGCWLMMITESVKFIIQISKKKTFNFINSRSSGKIKIEYSIPIVFIIK